MTNACLALEVHAELEEEIFYPALRAVMSEDPIFQKSEPEHAEMRRLIGELRERVITREELLRARSFYLINSVRRWMPAIFFD